MPTFDNGAGVTGNPIPLDFDPGGMNLLADSFPGNEYSSCFRSTQITWTSIFYPFVAKSILQHTTKKPAIPLNIKYTDVQRQSGGCDCGLFTIAYVSIINSQGI